MSAYHRRLITEEFRRCGGVLTTPQLAAVAGPNWPDRVKELRRHGYPLDGETVDGLWHLDLEELPASEMPEPELDAGGAVDAAHSRSAWEGDGSSPGIEGDAEPEPLFDAPAQPASPYDPSVEAA